MSVTIFGLRNVAHADAHISIAASYTVAVIDTAGPSNETTSNDTIQPAADVADDIIIADTNTTTDPPAVSATATIVSADAADENPAGDLYEDFDTTLVHAEKFDA
ncbi:MAG TPA: hypothetical protein VL651_03255, partial [Bacteroidia bacterium]|nr:hypothetical protein [Bacteroidia bacterium]